MIYNLSGSDLSTEALAHRQNNLLSLPGVPDLRHCISCSRVCYSPARRAWRNTLAPLNDTSFCFQCTGILLTWILFKARLQNEKDNYCPPFMYRTAQNTPHLLFSVTGSISTRGHLGIINGKSLVTRTTTNIVHLCHRLPLILSCGIMYSQNAPLHKHWS